MSETSLKHLYHGKDPVLTALMARTNGTDTRQTSPDPAVLPGHASLYESWQPWRKIVAREIVRVLLTSVYEYLSHFHI